MRELERMADEVAAWAARQAERVRHHRHGALRQELDAAVPWEGMRRDPAMAAGRNRSLVRARWASSPTGARGAGAGAASPPTAPSPAFAAATGLRPEEWRALERGDVDRRARVLRVARTVSGGELVDLGKTTRWRRQVLLSQRVLDALDATAPRLDSPLLVPAPRGGLVTSTTSAGASGLRQWAPA